MTLKRFLRLIRRLRSADRLDLIDRFNVLRDIASTIVPEYRFKWPQMTWWNHPQFVAYLERFGEADGNNADRRWAIFQLLRLAGSVDGDTAEVGAYQGAMSYLILSANDGRRHHHIFDSFEGLSAPAPVDGTHWAVGSLACPEDVMRANLSAFDGFFSCYKGWVPSRFDAVAGKRFSFVHLDVDLYEPTRDSVAFFYPRLAPGAVAVCDDYGFTTCPGATLACDEYLADKPEKMISLPDGGGFFIKGTWTETEPKLTR